MRSLLPAVCVSLAAIAASAQVLPYEKAGVEAFQRKDFKRCAELLDGAVKRGPATAIRPAAVAARCHAELGDLSQAERYLDIALSRGYRSCRSLEESAIWMPLRGSSKSTGKVERCHANEERYYGSLNAEVFAAFVEDQADRKADSIDRERTLAHDEGHRGIVRLALARNLLKTSDDYYHAAMVMQHGTAADDYALARKLAERAVRIDASNAPAAWLIAAATDRYLHKIGAPQVYGTQLKQVDGRWTLEPFDPDGVTDEERIEHGVPTVAERRAEIENLNAPAKP